MAPKTIAWLSSRSHPPVPLAEGTKVLLGRGQDCGLVLDHSAVSRRHAGLQVHGGRILLVDLGSSNGTLVNSRRVTQTLELRIGDRIELGPFELTVSPAQQASKKEKDKLGLSDTKEFVPSAATDLSGRIGKVGLAEILQVIELYEKTGTLKVESPDAVGELVVVQGKPRTARFGTATDQAAVLRIIRLQSGTFNFVANVDERVRTTMSTTLSSLVMEAARMDDEFRRSRERHVDSEVKSFFDLHELLPPLPGDDAEKTRVVSRLRVCASCKQKVDGLRETCERCGAPFRTRR
jgi:pSer/pThr/pTyr-binding forkhead associated (FHA) protein